MISSMYSTAGNSQSGFSRSSGSGSRGEGGSLLSLYLSLKLAYVGRSVFPSIACIMLSKYPWPFVVYSSIVRTS